MSEEQRLNMAMTRRANAQKLLEHRDLVRFCRALVLWGEKHPDGRLNDFLSFTLPPSREVLALDAVPAGTAIMTR